MAQRRKTSALELCKDLGLDGGYLSRILAGFQKAGLVEKRKSPTDARQALLSLTKEGRKAFAALNARSSEQVGTMPGKLLPAKQGDLIQAMATIEFVLSSAAERTTSYVLRQHRPGDMGWVAQRHGTLYWQEYSYDERFEALVAGIVAEFIRKLDPAKERCWIAEKDGENVGAVFLVKKSSSVAKLRLLLVEPSVRGLGIGNVWLRNASALPGMQATRRSCCGRRANLSPPAASTRMPASRWWLKKNTRVGAATIWLPKPGN
jgi:DNA-binding MarR family transcriptional regulator